ALHGRPHAQLRPRVLALGIHQAHENDVVKLEDALRRGAADRERKDAAIGKTDLERLAAAAHRRLLDHDRREPMHVIEWKPRALERLPPSRRIRRLALGFDTTDRLREVCFATLELRAA